MIITMIERKQLERERERLSCIIMKYFSTILNYTVKGVEFLRTKKTPSSSLSPNTLLYAATAGNILYICLSGEKDGSNNFTRMEKTDSLLYGSKR